MYDDIAYSKDDIWKRKRTCIGIRHMYDDIVYSKDDIQNTQCTCIGTRHMYDDITYRKDDIQTRGTDVLEYVICMTIFRGEITIFRK